jgi:uncharacterized protein YjbI with pentapeptide repeats
MSDEFNLQQLHRRGESFDGQCFSVEISDWDAEAGSFIGGRFHHSAFRRCNFTGASFIVATLDYVFMRGCNLTDISFDDIDSQELTLLECNVNGASFVDANIGCLEMIDCHGRANFDSAYLQQAQFNCCDLVGSTFRNAHLDDSEFINCDLTGVLTSKETRMRRVSFRGSTLTEAHLVTAMGSQTCFYENALVLPYIKDLRKNISLLEKTPKRAIVVTRDSIYSNPKDITAKLFCSDKSEFKRVKHA